MRNAKTAGSRSARKPAGKPEIRPQCDYCRNRGCRQCDRKPKPGEAIIIRTQNSVRYDVYRPARKRTESPVQYYRKYGVVPSDFTSRHNGRYYCNPAHCSRSWKIRANRDAHLERAYTILG